MVRGLKLFAADGADFLRNGRAVILLVMNVAGVTFAAAVFFTGSFGSEFFAAGRADFFARLCVRAGVVVVFNFALGAAEFSFPRAGFWVKKFAALRALAIHFCYTVTAKLFIVEGKKFFAAEQAIIPR